MKRGIFTALATLTLAGLANAGPIEVADLYGFLHVNGSLVDIVDRTSASYSSAQSDNLGTFGWALTNPTATPWENVVFLAFLDADIDRADNSASNEVGEFVGLTRPPGAPADAITASSWEIDEPGFVFGDVVANLFAGALDGTNAVDASSPDDVSLALGFVIGQLAAGSTTTITLTTSLDDIGGLRQRDLHSNNEFYFNGVATRSSATSVSPVPEPSSLVLLTLGVVGAAVTRRLRQS